MGRCCNVAPASTSGSTTFTVTYDKVPQDACIQIAHESVKLFN
ncbi:hypothetical protein MWG46_20035 [Escherichia coli]|nr:hypothetical protein [Escherichia coli]